MDPTARDRLARIGLNCVGVADGTGWDRVLSGCRSIVVVGSGGPALWEAFVRAGPRPWRDPLDTFVRDAVSAVVPGAGRWVFSSDAHDVDFRTLAVAAGLGWPSRLGLVLHPVWGTWLGLRAAWFTTEGLTPTGPLPSPPACDGCPAPCVSACPGNALAPAFDIGACSAFRLGDPRCGATCAARTACPVGVEHRYPAEELRYHMASPRTVPTAPPTGSDPGAPAPPP